MQRLWIPLLLLLTSCGNPAHDPGFLNSVVTEPRFARDFSLTDPQGQQHHLADYRGKVVVIFFGYTQCPDVCPTTLSVMAETMRLLGSEATRVQVLFVTLDPERDTPQLLATYVPQFHPTFVGLSGDAQHIAATAREFNVIAVKRAAAAGTATADAYSIDHSTYSYLYNPQGQLRLLAKYGATAETLAHDIHRLLAEK
ncbi:MAG: SCO family protein [Sterolibacterium sp.]|jgi:protein SCO1/2|nr:SCO family protein [Sterolibacterium sp.]